MDQATHSGSVWVAKLIKQLFTEVEVTWLVVVGIYQTEKQLPNGRRVFLPTNKTFEGICLALAGKFLQKEL